MEKNLEAKRAEAEYSLEYPRDFEDTDDITRTIYRLSLCTGTVWEKKAGGKGVQIKDTRESLLRIPD